MDDDDVFQHRPAGPTTKELMKRLKDAYANGTEANLTPAELFQILVNVTGYKPKATAPTTKEPAQP